MCCSAARVVLLLLPVLLAHGRDRAECPRDPPAVCRGAERPTAQLEHEGAGFPF